MLDIKDDLNKKMVENWKEELKKWKNYLENKKHNNIQRALDMRRLHEQVHTQKLL